LAVPTNNSYKIYSEDLAIKVVSPPLMHSVKAVLCENEFSYARAGDKVIKMKYHHIVREWSIPSSKADDQSTLIKFADLILLGEGNKVFIIDEKDSETVD
jgi:hypothetical protein